jgi:DNA adenine methylase
MEPLLKWVGSKRWQVDMLRPAWETHGRGRIVELFAGSAALSFGFEAEHAHLNDANPHLINFYRRFLEGNVQDFSGCTTEAEYYKRRDWFNRLSASGTQDRWAAGLFYYLNCTAFNNLWRVNSRGEFNVPFRKGRENVPELGAMPSRHWTFSNDDFRDVILEPTDFVYADPPYLGTFEGYTPEGFSEFDFAELVALLSGHPSPVVICNSATPLAIETCQSAGLHCMIVESQQRMHNSRGRDDKVSELVATNFRLTGAV